MKKYFNLIFIAIGILLLVATNSCLVGRVFIYNFADIRDHKKFPAHEIQNSETQFTFYSAEKGKVPRELTVQDKNYAFEKYIEENNTVAFLIIQNDTIQFEKYWDNYDETSIVPSFSMAKSVVSMLIGTAIADGLIRDVQQPITDFIPELKANGFETVTIEHVLQMKE